MCENIVQNHDMLLYRPFIEGGVVVPITFEHYSQVIKAYNELRYQLLVKPDWYWSCRSRSAFMNIDCSEKTLSNAKDRRVNCV